MSGNGNISTYQYDGLGNRVAQTVSGDIIHSLRERWGGGYYSLDAIQPLWLVIKQIDALPWDHALYLGGDKPWNASTPTAVLDPDDVDGLDEDENPAFAVQMGLQYVLSVQEVQDIVENTRQQKNDTTLDDLLAAFNFYYDNDAYIELTFRTPAGHFGN